MEATKVLEDVLAKTVKNTSNENRKRAVEALQTLFLESSNPKQVVEFLVKLHYSVCQAFFEEFCSSASDESIIGIAEALINDEQFIKGNPNNIMYPKGLSAVLALACKGKYQAAFLVLLRILSQSEKNDGFSDGCVNNFRKLILDKDGRSFILALFDQAMDGSIVCEENEHRRLARFLRIVDDKKAVISREETPIAMQNIESAEQFVGEADRPVYANSTTVSKQIIKSKSAEEASTIEKTQQDILAYIRRLADNQSSINALTASLSRRDDELDSLRAVLAEKEHRIVSLASQVEAKDEQFLAMKRQVDDLTERLRASLHMDDISKNQELITLKNDISEALKLDYADFTKSRENPYSEDLFEAYRSTLTRIFKVLRRFGITY